jgi:hypothetical protein
MITSRSNAHDGIVCKMADNLADDDGDLWWRTPMSYRVGCPEQEYNHWRSVGASNRILGKPEPYRTWGTEENNIRNLTNVLKNVSILGTAVHLR